MRQEKRSSLRMCNITYLFHVTLSNRKGCLKFDALVNTDTGNRLARDNCFCIALLVWIDHNVRCFLKKPFLSSKRERGGLV